MGHNLAQSGASVATRRELPRIEYRQFVSIDGEATTARGDYGLIAASSGQYLQRRDGLSTEALLEWLLALPKHRTANGSRPIYVGFAIDYDVNQILKDLPLKGETSSIEELRKTGKTKWRGFRITYYRRKIFRVGYGRQVFSLYDTWGYFQSSFEKALAGWKIETPAIITAGKAERGNFQRWPLWKIRQYNEAELSTHVELMNQLRESIRPLNLTVRSWHGPAALAGYWLAEHGIERYLKANVEALEKAAQIAYFAGRIDVKGYGFVTPCYHYDLVSAYPSATRYLPNLSGARWARTKHVPNGSRVYVVHIRWRVPSGTIWPPFPWRSKTGTIRYPTEGEGWYWHPEIEACRAVFGECFEVLECISIQGEPSYPLKPLIEETFAYRAELKAAGNPSHVPVKLILNSIYGKFCQQLGRAQYRNRVWAGLITSHTRANLMRAITDDTVLVMTDSVFSASPLNVPIGDGLGEWELQPEDSLAVAEAGLYAASIQGADRRIWQRGFDRANPVDIDHIVGEWLDGDMTYSPVYPVHRFIGMGLASVSHYEWRKWVKIERTIHAVPLVGTTKRQPFFPDCTSSRQGDFVSLPVRAADELACSYPYIPTTIDPELKEFRLQDECSEEGDN